MTKQHLNPLQDKNRIIEIDVIRGFALFGVLLVNITMIDATLYAYVASAFDHVDPLTRLSALLIHIFAVGKFYTLFSILFGLGFYYFMNKQDGTTVSAHLFRRRLFALFCFGMLHLTFVWYGDILHVYAITGVVLLNSRNRSSRSLLKTAILLFLLSTSMFAWFQGSGAAQGDMSAIMREAEMAYSQPSYLGMVYYRVMHELPLIAFNFLTILPKILSLFMFGYYIGTRQIFESLEDNRMLINRVWRISGKTALFCGLGYTLIMGGYVFDHLDVLAVIFDELLTISGALFYATSLILLYRSPKFKKIVSPLKYPGKMALTNYLMQTICFTTLIYGYGAGLYGKIPYWVYFPIAVVFYTVQVLGSKWWLKHHKFGPMESIWRQFTYS